MIPHNLSDEERLAVDEKAFVEYPIVKSYLARIPPAWNYLSPWPPPDGQAGAIFGRSTVQVIASLCTYEDRRIWIHVSATGRTGLDKYYTLTFEQLKRVKNDFIGPDRWAYQVFPDERHYVNQHPTVLHLYSLLEGEPALPDFTLGLGNI